MADPKFRPVFDAFPSCMGGRTLFLNNYIYEFVPGHRLQNHWGFVPQHRLVAEQKLGRNLRKGELVHHIDETPTNNHPDNLEIMSALEHIQHHGKLAGARNLAKINREQVIEALDGRSLKDAARLLHVDTMTLRNRFPDLLEPRKRKSPVKIGDDLVQQVLACAVDPKKTVLETAAQLGLGYVSINRICKRNGVKWLSQRAGKQKRTYRGLPIHCQ